MVMLQGQQLPTWSGGGDLLGSIPCGPAGLRPESWLGSAYATLRYKYPLLCLIRRCERERLNGYGASTSEGAVLLRELRRSERG